MDLQQLLGSLVPTIKSSNEPKRQSCGAPNFILTKKDIPVDDVERKDIGDTDLKGFKKVGNKEQFEDIKKFFKQHLYRATIYVLVKVRDIFCQ